IDRSRVRRSNTMIRDDDSRRTDEVRRGGGVEREGGNNHVVSPILKLQGSDEDAAGGRTRGERETAGNGGTAVDEGAVVLWTAGGDDAVGGQERCDQVDGIKRANVGQADGQGNGFS